MSETIAYDPEVFPGVAKKLCELDALNSDLAEAFCTNEDTIKLWAKTHPDFSNACIEGRQASYKRVNNMLLKIARGSEFKRERIVSIRGTPARIVTKEKGSVSATAVAALAAFYERNKYKMDIGNPLTELARQLMGTGIKIPPENAWAGQTIKKNDVDENE